MGLEPEPAIRVKNPSCIALLCQCPPSCPLLQQSLLEAWASREGKTWCLQKAGNQKDKHIYCDIQCCGVHSYHLDQFLYVGFQLDCKLGKHHPLYIGVYTIHTPYLSDYRASLIKKLIIRSSRWQKQIEKKKKKKEGSNPSSSSSLSCVGAHDSHAVQGYTILYTHDSRLFFAFILYVNEDKDDPIVTQHARIEETPSVLAQKQPEKKIVSKWCSDNASNQAPTSVFILCTFDLDHANKHQAIRVTGSSCSPAWCCIIGAHADRWMKLHLVK